MQQTNEFDPTLWILIGVIAVPVIISLIAGVCKFINYFSQELKYLNSEIKRTSGSERAYWIRQRRKLWLSIIPFVKY